MEDWNWQVKEASAGKRQGSSSSPKKNNQKQNFAQISDDDNAIENEILRVDEELEQEDGYFFRGKGKAKPKNRTPSTQGTDLKLDESEE